MWFIPIVVLGSWFLASKAKASSVSATTGSTKEQLNIMAKIRAEAIRQKVPVELALATADLESGFKNTQNVTGGNSFGPMQVNVINLKPGETVEQLKNLDFNIRRGVEIIKRYLTKAGGDTYKARVLYFCGQGMCGGNPPERLISRWNVAVQKWAIPSFYLGFSG